MFHLIGFQTTDLVDVISQKFANLCEHMNMSYALLRMPISDDKQEDFCYSILLIQFEENICTDSIVLYDVSRKQEDGVKLLELLARNFVTPVCAHEVISELLPLS